MKTEAQILAQAPSRQEQQDEYSNYLHYNEEGSLPEHITLVYHVYSYEDYSGESYGFGYDSERDEWFEVYGGHCSCYGLEGQWEPQYSSFESLMHAIERTLEAEHYRSQRNSEQLAEFVGWER